MAKKGEKKVVTKNNLQYSRGGPKWFDKAKKERSGSMAERHR